MAVPKPELARLIVPLDTSAMAETVLPWAALVARDHAMVVHLLAVWSADAPVPSIEPGTDAEEAVDRLHHYLQEIAEHHELSSVPVEVEVREGDIASEVREAAAKHRGSMVMLSSHGAGGYQKSHLGSVTDELVRTLHVPVLVLPASE